MKLLSLDEMLALNGNIIFAPFYGSHADQIVNMDVGGLEVLFEKHKNANWYSYPLSGTDIQSLSGCDPDELQTIIDMIDGADIEMGYESAANRKNATCYKEGQRFIVLDDSDVTTMIFWLLKFFPDQASKASAMIQKENYP